MKFTRAALQAAALLSTAQNVAGIDLNVDDDNSIKQAGKTICQGMLKWYTGMNPGDVPGNLPSPYYWWEAGAMFQTLMDYWYYTGDDSHNDITLQAMMHQVGEDKDYQPSNQTNTAGNDDQAFWAMAALRAAEINYPDPPKGQPQWLALAQAVFNEQTRRWDTSKCGGGLKWQIHPFNKGYDYRNTISNGCYFNLGARLARYTGNNTYAELAERTWDWLQKVGFLTDKWEVYDGAKEDNDCKNFVKFEWTYNTGILLHGAATLWNVTQDGKWKDRTMKLLDASERFFNQDKAKDVMFEKTCEPFKKCNNDQRSFKAYLAWSYAYAYKMLPEIQDRVMGKLKASAVAAAKQCNAGPDQTTCGLTWLNNGANDGSFGPGEQMAAMEVVISLLSKNVGSPVTAKTGGTSQGDAGAGAEGDKTPKEFRPMTTGDKAGAAILTILMVGFTGAFVWFTVFAE